jgi:SAM-dependent methyltransferase
LTRTSLIYRHAAVYELLMRVLYGRHHAGRLRAVAQQIPPGATVLELCCGPGSLYVRHLRGRAGSYIGLDANPGFVARLKARGVDARLTDLTTNGEVLPPAEVVVIQASLYHFLPDADRILRRMVTAASRLVIVSEPVRNLSSSRLPVIGSIGRRATDPGVGAHTSRFTEATLDRVMSRYDGAAAFLAPGGRDKVYVVDVTRSVDSSSS